MEGLPEILVHASTPSAAEADLIRALDDWLERKMDHDSTRIQLDDMPTVRLVRMLVPPPRRLIPSEAMPGEPRFAIDIENRINQDSLGWPTAMGGTPDLEDLLSSNWPALRDFKPQADEWLAEAARGMPPRFHRRLRKALLESLLDRVGAESEQPLLLHLVIDSGIIVTDSFGVGRGFKSSTPRLFQSPFVRAYAPAEAWEEVPRIIRERHPRDVDVDAALRQGETVLKSIRRIDAASPASVRRAASLIGRHSPEDICFLAVALDVEADAVISYDKAAYDSLEEIDRWTMKDGSQAILGYESGTMSLGIAGAAAEVLSHAVQLVFAALFRAFAEVLAVIGAILTWLATRSAEALERIPEWALWVALAAAVGFAIALIASEEFREWVGRGLSKAGALVAAATRRVIEFSRGLWEGLRELLMWLWTNIARPLAKGALLATGVLLSHIDQLIREVEARSAADSK